MKSIFLRVTTCAAILSLLGTPALAQLDQPGASTASWIGLGQPTGSPNQWFAYRKTINLSEDPSSAVFDIATDSKYWLWINGQMVVFEGGLKRGPTPTDSYFDRVDVSPYLHAGDNTVALLHWYFGREGFSHKDSGSPGMIFDGQIDDQTIVSDQSWRVTRHSAYGTSPSQQIDFRLPESNIRFNQSLDLGNWQTPSFDDSGWSTPTVLGAPGDAPWNGLVERNIPQWKDFGKRTLSTGSFVSDGQELSYQLPYQAQFTPYFRIAVPGNAAGQTVTMLTETNGLSQTRGEYVTAAGQHNYESYGWISGEELRIRFPAGVTVLEVGYRETGFKSEFIDRFVSDDQRVNSLMDKGARTLYLNMRDNFFDTPDRERAAWWGDIVNELGQAFYTLDRDTHSLIRKSVLNLADWSRPDGTLFSPIPAGNWNQELPMQMLASVGHYGFGNYYRHTGDVDTISHVYPKVNDYVMNVWQLNSNGLVDTSRIVGSPTMWVWFDWGANIDREPIANGWYYLALKGQREQAIATGNQSDLAAIDQRMQSIEANFDSTFWDASAQAYRSSGHAGLPDDRANALAVLSGLADPSRYNAIRQLLVKQEQASPFFELYAAEALGEMGFPADGMMRLRRRYEDQINAAQSTLGELFGGGGTKNHAWNAPLTFFAEYVTGIRPIEAGYDSYRVRPNFAGLNAARQSVDTVKGLLNVTMKRTDVTGPTAGYELSLSSPDGSQAVISLPLDGIRSFDQVTVNGQVVYDNGVPTNIAGFTYSGVSGGRLEFEADPGHWDIDVVGQQAGYFTTRSWQSDTDLPLDASAIYTHAIDFSPGGITDQTIGGTNEIGRVQFTNESVGSGFTGTNGIGGQDNLSGARWSISGIEFAYEGIGSRAPGAAGGELSDGLVGGGDEVTLELQDLDQDTDYVLTLFSPLWNGNTDRVAILDGNDDGLGQGMTIAVVQDADAELLIMQYRYNTGDATSFQMHFDNITSGETLHHYAFTNELATELVTLLPLDPGDANKDGVVDILDFELISDNFLNTVPLGTMGDVVEDGIVDAKDFRQWKERFILTGGDPASIAHLIPEPSSLWLTLLFLMLLSRSPEN